MYGAYWGERQGLWLGEKKGGGRQHSGGHADGQKNFLFGCHRFLLLSINQDTSRPLSPWEIVSNISTTPSVLLSPKCTHCVQRSIRLPAAKTNAGGVIVLGGRQPGNESYAVSLRRCPKKTVLLFVHRGYAHRIIGMR